MQAGTKRGRGRPKKDASHQSQDSQPGSVDRLLDMLDEPEAGVEVQPTAKAKAKGRPRKENAEQLPSQRDIGLGAVSDEDTSPAQREREVPEGPSPKAKAKGRPRKENAEQLPSQVPEVETRPQTKREWNSKASVEGGSSPASSKRSKVEEKSRERPQDKVPVPPGEEFEWVEDPTDERLTVAGAKHDAQSRLMLVSYNDLKGSFAGEPSPEKHPDSSNPGLRRRELPGGSAEVCLDGLKNWRDSKGAGWIAHRKVGKKLESRWFSARTWGSWRLAFLLARLQQQVWKPASSGGESSSSSSAPPAADPPAAGPSEPKVKVLSGKDEWLAFSPKEVDLTLCLARSWNEGHGGQCQEPRSQGADLCSKHRTQAVSTRGLCYGFVDGPIPAAKLTEFQHAALRIAAGLSVSKKQQPPQSIRKHDASGSSKGEGSTKQKTVKHKLKVKLKQPKPKLKSVALSTYKAPTGQAPEAAPITAELQPMDEGQTRRRRHRIRSKQKLKDMRDNEHRFWSGVDSAMDAAIAQQEQHELDFEPASLRGILHDIMDKEGHVNEDNIGKTVKIMESLDNLDARLGLAAVLRRSVRFDLTRAAVFVSSGGVGALRPWLQAALPQNDETQRAGSMEEQRKREQVVLECLALLSRLPVTYDVLQRTGIGRTLTALRGYCAPAMEPAGRLIAQWRNDIRSEARPNQQGASKEPVGLSQGSSQTKTSDIRAASSHQAPGKRPTQTAPPMPAQPPIRRETPANIVSPAVVAATSLRPEMTTHAASPPVAPASFWQEVTTPPAGSEVKAALAPSILHRGRRQPAARRPQNTVEATLRNLFILGEVLERGGDTGTQAAQPISSSSTAAIDLSAEDID